MPAYRVTWTQAAIATAVVDVELSELARWAIRSGSIRASGELDPTTLERSIERNAHLRDALLRLYSTQQN